MPSFVSIGKILKPIPSYRRHQHESTWELVLYTRGRGTATVGDQPIPFYPGTIICMPPQVPHEEISDRGFTNIFMHVKDFDRFAGAVPRYQDRPGRPYFRVSALLLKEFQLRQQHSDLIVESLFQTLIYYLQRWGLKTGADPMVEELKESFVEHLSDPDFQVSSALGDLPLSGDHLRKRFRSATGCSPLQYLHELRITEAKRMLRIGGLSVKEVAQQVGIPDPYYFSRLFHKVTGKRPSSYARRQLETPS